MTNRKLKLRTIPSLRREIMPCALCAEPVLHGAVEGPGAELVFRASVDLRGIVWIPLVGHADPRFCPDPPRETGDFWHIEVRREAWKAARRAERTIQ